MNTGPSARYRLRALGTLDLTRDGEGVAHGDRRLQRRRLALLATLGASADRGCSRDQLLLFFWPESSQSNARHSLEQLLYEIRSALDENIFIGGNPLRLNPAVITVDVCDFEDTVKEHRLEAAVENYGGSFLDGFYLADSPEFEQWVDKERARLQAKYHDVLERLADAAEQAREAQVALRWRRKLAESDPLSSRYAMGLMKAMAAAGDRAGAVRHGEQYGRQAEEELGPGNAEEVAALVRDLRSRAVIQAAESPIVTAKEEPASGGEARPLAPVSSSDQPVSLSPSPQRRKSRAFVYAMSAIIGAAAILGALAARRGSAHPPTAAAVPSIAVLPLISPGNDPNDAALASAMTEELITMLARLGGVRVIASTSVSGFRSERPDVRRIADSLKVSNVLEGGLQRVGSRLRVRLRLIDAADGSTRWSEVYDRQLGDVFAVQDDVAQAVARELDLRLGRSGSQLLRHRTSSVAAFEFYLRGRDPTALRTDSGIRAAAEQFRLAVAADSNYAAAHAGLAHMYAQLAYHGELPVSSQSPLAQAAELHALKAIALDDSSAEAHAALGYIRAVGFKNISAAEREFKRSLELDPGSSETRELMAVVDIWNGRNAEALAEARRAVEINPLSASSRSEVARALMINERYDEALLELRGLASIRPPLRRTPLLTGLCYLSKGMWPEAMAALRSPAIFPTMRAQGYVGFALARSGQQDEARKVMADLQSRWKKSGTGAFAVMSVHAGLGDREEAFRWLDRAVDDYTLTVDIMAPFFADLRRDPRFELIKKRLGIQKR